MRNTFGLVKKIEIGKNKNKIECAVSILIFLLVTLWIVFFNNGINLIVTCIVRYFIGMIAFFIIKYSFIFPELHFPVKKIRANLPILVVIGMLSLVLNAMAVQLEILSEMSKRWIFITFLIGVCVYTIVLYNINKITEELLLSLAVFLTGTAFAFSLPAVTGLSWDDQTHYERVLQISQMGSTNISEAELTVINMAYTDPDKDTERGEAYVDYLAGINDLYKEGKSVITPYSDMSIGVSISYIPMVCMVLLAKGLSLPLYLVVIVGRWGNVIFYSILMYLALRKIKSGKLLAFTLSMFPTTICLMSNYSYDLWGVGFSLYAYCYYFGILQNKSRKMSYKDIIIISLSFIIGFSAKPIYFCMALLPLLIRKDKLAYGVSLLKYRLIVICTSTLIMLTFLCPFLFSGAGGNDMRGGSEVNSSAQLLYILKNPFEYASTLLNFLKYYWSFDNSKMYINSMAYLNSDFNRYSMIVIFVVLVVVIIFDRVKNDCHVLLWRERIGVFCLAFASSALVATALYIAYTPVALNTINGCQGRYLLPLLFVVYYCLGGFKFEKKLSGYLRRSVLVNVISIVLFCYTMTFLFKYVMPLYTG